MRKWAYYALQLMQRMYGSHIDPPIRPKARDEALRRLSTISAEKRSLDSPDASVDYGSFADHLRNETIISGAGLQRLCLGYERAAVTD